MAANAPIVSNPPTLAQPPGYAQIVEVGPGRLIFIAGQVAWDTQGKLVGAGDFALQAEQVFRNLLAAVESRGGTAASLVKLTIFVTDMQHLPLLRQVRDRFIPAGPAVPASTLVQVAALFRPEFLIEVEAVAWLPA